MPRLKPTNLASLVGDKLADPWKLLSETTVFLARTPLLKDYEAQLRRLRAKLQDSRGAPDAVKEVRDELIEIRKILRSQGWDLSLGRKNLVFEGFRNDACLGEGFKRIVLFLSDSGGWWLTGESNHIEIASYLEERLRSSGLGPVRERHYLWYAWRGNDLVLSGSATETAEDFERLKSIGQAQSLKMLSILKNLR